MKQKMKPMNLTKMMMLLQVASDGGVISNEQADEIMELLTGNANNSNCSDMSNGTQTLLYGIRGLAEFLHVSLPTAQKLKNSGDYAEAMIHFGKKIAWDKEKVINIAKSK